MILSDLGSSSGHENGFIVPDMLPANTLVGCGVHTGSGLGAEDLIWDDNYHPILSSQWDDIIIPIGMIISSLLG